MKTNFKRCAIAAAVSFAIAAPYSWAAEAEKDSQAQSQENQNNLDNQSNQQDEKIVITGSRIKRDSFSVTTPLVTLDREEIEDTGLGSLSEILIESMPGVGANNSNTNSQSSVQNTGLSTIDLRDLGVDRTLTLIDGRRVVSNSYSGNYVSLSTIPSGMVERVEIITGGASAIYGSDAVAGVVNIITQQDKEGFELNLRHGYTLEGGGEQYRFDFDWGGSFNDGKTYSFFSINYDKDEGISWHDRERAQQEAYYIYDDDEMCNAFLTVDGFQCARDITPADWTNRSDGTAGGVFEEGLDAANGGFYYNTNGLQTGWNEELHGLDTAQFVQLKVPDEAISAALKIDHQFNSEITGYAQVQFARNESFNNKDPEDEYESAYVLYYLEDGTPDEVRPGYIETDNPFVPQIIRDNASGTINWDRRFFEVGNVQTHNTRTTIRSWAGLQGTIFDNAWDWDLSVGYGKFKQEQLRLNELNTIRVAQALDAEYADDGVTIQCADPDARAAGCVPLNIFGVGSITPEMANWIRVNPSIETNISQTNVLGYVAGDLFDMPAGAVSSVFGFEYRKDSQDVMTSEGHQRGGITFNVVPAFEADMSVTEIFGEASFPLARNAAAAKNLAAEVSYRIADYNNDNSGTIGSYKFGFIWEPIQGYSFRANWANAQRAPTLTDLFSPPRGDFDSFNDICDGVTADSTGLGHDACRLDPGIAATIAAEGEFQDDNNGYSPNAGNELLIHESAETFTFGLSMEPIEDFRIAIDYYDITVDDAIGQVSNANIIRECYASETQPFGDDNRYCNLIRRNSEGQIIEVQQIDENISELSTKGYDIALEYKIDLNDYGRLNLKADATHVDKYQTSYEGNDGLVVEDYVGQLAYGIFDDVASASLTWYKDGWRVRWTTRYMSSIIDYQDRLNEYAEFVADNNERCQANDADCIANPESLEYAHFSAYLKHSLSVSYAMDLEDQSELRLYGGVRNIFDDVGPFSPTSGDVGARNTGNSITEYDGGVGRYVYFGAEYKF